MRRLHAYLLLLAVLCAASCTEDFTPDIKQSAVSKYVVDGLITTESTAHCVKLSKSAPYGTAAADMPLVHGATVSITDGMSTVLLHEDGQTGCYLTPDDYKGEVGVAYKLSVDIPEEGSTVHLEGVDMIPPEGFRVDAFDYYQMADSVWVFAIWGQDLPGLMSHYCADLRVNGEGHGYNDWIFMDGNQILDGNYLNAGEYLFYLSGESILTPGVYNEPLKTGDVVEMYLYSMSDYFFSFRCAMANESSAHIPLFSPQPANLPTNITGGAFGCFVGSNVSRHSVVIGDPQRTHEQMLMDHMSLR